MVQPLVGGEKVQTVGGDDRTGYLLSQTMWPGLVMTSSWPHPCHIRSYAMMKTTLNSEYFMLPWQAARAHKMGSRETCFWLLQQQHHSW